MTGDWKSGFLDSLFVKLRLTRREFSVVKRSDDIGVYRISGK